MADALNPNFNMPVRIHEESRSPNRKIYRESAVHVATNHLDVSRHREKPGFIYDRVPEERTEMYGTWRKDCEERDGYVLNRRFPELEKAKADFVGEEPNRSSNKKLHT